MGSAERSVRGVVLDVSGFEKRVTFCNKLTDETDRLSS